MNDLSQYNIRFRIDDAFIRDFFALKEGYEKKLPYIDCLKDELVGDLHALYAAGWISLDDVRFVESKFIYSNERFIVLSI